MTESLPIYRTNGRMITYELTQAEQRYLARFQQMQNQAARQGNPVALLVFFDGRTVSFFDGNPSGIVKDE